MTIRWAWDPIAMAADAPNAGESRAEVPRVPLDQLELTTPLAMVAGVRRDHADALARIGVRAVAHLLDHLPHRHERELAESSIASITPGELCTVRGEITATRLMGPRFARRGGPKPRFEAVLADDDSRLDLVWFNQAFLRDRIRPGMRLRVQGKATERGPGLQMANPVWEMLEDDDEPTAREARLRPIYPATEGATPRQIAHIAEMVVPAALRLIEDHLPEDFRRERALPTLADAYRMMHAPESEAEIEEARRRLVYDELLLLQLGMRLRRERARAAAPAAALERTDDIDARVCARIPFALTAAQARVVEEITADLAKPEPAHRLVQGDVGSGKTVVALYAMLLAAAHGHQAAMMAPTELLAEQHYRSIEQMLSGSRVRLARLTGAMDATERTDVERALAAGEIDLVVGTHALIAGGITFASLAVAVIDEQHRFGVGQRGKLGSGEESPDVRLSADGITPHTLVMTATPIPRTLATALFGELEVSVIDELPPGRTPVQTAVVPPSRRTAVYDRLRTRLEAGEQAFIVVPAIDTGDGELIDLRSLEKELGEGPLHGLRLGVMHGRLKSDTRAAVMERFRAGEIAALLATTVIEVGVDVPDATIMVIEHAERFGLAQLHQLRGRVGRGDKPGYCVLIGEPTTDEARARLDAMAATTDGFELAERDLAIRGPGEVLGLRQAGASPLRLADLERDHDLLAMARRDASTWAAASPDLDRPEDRLIARRLRVRLGYDTGSR